MMSFFLSTIAHRNMQALFFANPSCVKTYHVYCLVSRLLYDMFNATIVKLSN